MHVRAISTLCALFSPSPPHTHLLRTHRNPQPEDEEDELQIVSVTRVDSRMSRLMNNVNLMMSDSIRELAQALA